MKHLLDTNTCIKYLKGNPGVIRRLSSLPPSDIAVCSVVKAELMYGAMRSNNPTRTLRVQQAFLVQFQSLPFDDQAGLIHGRIRAQLTAAGTPIGAYDLQIAAIAQSVAEKVNGIVAPTLNYGYKSQPRSGGGQHFSGTTSLDGNNLSQIARDDIREFTRQGVNNIIVFDGHYENQWFLTEGIDLALRDLGSQSSVRVMRLEYWDFFTETTLEKVFPNGFPGFALEHAAVMETSLMLHYYPDMVRLDLIPDVEPAEFSPYDIYPYHTHMVPALGVLSSAKEASVEKGALMAAQLSEHIAAAVIQEFFQ